jgi:hypothetical protein
MCSLTIVVYPSFYLHTQENPADSLVSAGELAKQVVEVSKIDPCTWHQYDEVTYCHPNQAHGKVIILTHDQLFKDGNHGQGASNLPELRHFIRLMKHQGFVFKTLDQYAEVERV